MKKPLKELSQTKKMPILCRLFGRIALDWSLLALGLPISFHKMELGPRLIWIGLEVDFEVDVWGLPEDKRSRILLFLSALVPASGSSATHSILRETVEGGIGLILWTSRVYRAVRRPPPRLL